MTKKSLGYVEMEWTCPSCSGRNPGHVTVCTHCGTPQPEDVQFEQAAEEKIIEDAIVIERAKAGPDIHCAFCGTRNPAGTSECIRCGADLSEGVARAKGGVKGAFRDQPAPDVICPNCGSANPATALQCANCGTHLKQPKTEPEPVQAAPPRSRQISSTLIAIVIAVLLCACLAGAYFLFGRTNDITGQVSNVSWERQIVILGLAPVSRENWRDDIPFDADIGQCRDEVRYVSDQPEPNSQEICGTPYTVDTGSGFGEVLQDCQYQVYDSYCSFTALELLPVTTMVSDGDNLAPRWPEVQLAEDQEEGQRTETYHITFRADGETYTYSTQDPDEYALFEPGSLWTLKVNALGNVNEIEPAN